MLILKINSIFKLNHKNKVFHTIPICYRNHHAKFETAENKEQSISYRQTGPKCRKASLVHTQHTHKNTHN